MICLEMPDVLRSRHKIKLGERKTWGLSSRPYNGHIVKKKISLFFFVNSLLAIQKEDSYLIYEGFVSEAGLSRGIGWISIILILKTF